DARGSAVQHREAVPAVLHRAELERGLRGERGKLRAVLAREDAGANKDQRVFRVLQRLGELARAETGERLSAGAEVIVGVGQIGLLADQRDREIAGAPA